MHKVTISIEIDTANLTNYTDEHLAACWHIAQANPADGFRDNQPGELAEKIGYEIICRWLSNTPPEMYHHQGRHYYWHHLTQFATYKPGGPAGEPEWDQGTWVAKPAEPGEAEAKPS